MKRLTALKKLIPKGHKLSPVFEKATLWNNHIIIENPVLHIRVDMVNPYFAVEEPVSVNFIQLYNAIKTTCWPAKVRTDTVSGRLVITDTGERRISTGEPVHKLPGAGNNFLKIHGTPVAHHLQNLDVEDIKNLYRASSFVARDLLRPVMNHIAIDGKTIVATDAHILFRRSMNMEVDPYGPMLMHSKIAEFLRYEPGVSIRSLTGEEDEDIKGYEIYNRYVGIIIKKSTDKYPDWEKVWPGSHNTHVKINREKFIEILTQLLPFTSSTDMVVLDLKHMALVVDNLYEGSKTTLPMPGNTVVTGDTGYNIGFKLRFLIQTLKNCDAEVAEMNITDPSKPAVVCGTLIMPVITH